ncbi:MAG: zinc ribbon domain-containing protein [Acetobacteraceae bacterium]
MPMYDYHCAANDRTVQVMHRITQDVTTWGEVCALAGIEPGDTPPDAPVSKVHLGANVVRRKALGSDSSGGSVYGAMTTTRQYHNTKNFD